MLAIPVLLVIGLPLKAYSPFIFILRELPSLTAGVVNLGRKVLVHEHGLLMLVTEDSLDGNADLLFTSGTERGRAIRYNELLLPSRGRRSCWLGGGGRWNVEGRRRRQGSSRWWEGEGGRRRRRRRREGLCLGKRCISSSGMRRRGKGRRWRCAKKEKEGECSSTSIEKRLPSRNTTNPPITPSKRATENNPTTSSSPTHPSNQSRHHARQCPPL